MKKTFLIVAALIVSMSLASCGTKNAKTPDTNTASEGSVEQQLADFGKNASDNVDMNKIEGETLTEAENAEGTESKADIGVYEVSVDDAKVIDYQDNKVVLVSFSFKNNSSSDINFAGAMSVEANQDTAVLAPAVVVGVEGFDSTTLAQNVSKGEKIKVQRAYNLADGETPVTIYVEAFDKTVSDASVEKTFNLK